MGQVIAEYKSKSKPGRTYKIQIGNDGVIYCDCWSWKINKTCKHIKDYWSNQAAQSMVLEEHHFPREIKPDPIQEAINEAVAFMKGNNAT